MKTYSKPERHYYLGYGMNTNVDSMRYRCPDAILVDTVKLPDHRFRFARHADVVYEPGAETWCALWDITNDDLASLDILEGYPRYYKRKLVTLTKPVYNTPYQAWVYYMARNEPAAWPDTSYLNMLQEGYAECRIPESQLIEALADLDGTKNRYNRAKTHLALTRKSLNSEDLWF